MNQLYEKDDMLNIPVQCFFFDSTKRPFPIKMHWHYYMEILYVFEGTAVINCSQKEYILHPGEMILLHSKSMHSINSQNGPIKMYGLKLDISRMSITSSYSPKLRSIFRSAERKNMPIAFSTEFTDRNDTKQHFEKCLKETEGHLYGYDLVMRSIIYQILTDILRSWMNQGFNIDQETFTADQYYDLYNITEYIDENLGRDLRVAEIAEQCKMSYSYFARKFLDAYGKSCKDYIEEMRLYKVEDLLRYTDFDLTYISQETGFSDCSHLIHQFKKYKGTTPKQFRLQNQKK